MGPGFSRRRTPILPGGVALGLRTLARKTEESASGSVWAKLGQTPTATFRTGDHQQRSPGPEFARHTVRPTAGSARELRAAEKSLTATLNLLPPWFWCDVRDPRRSLGESRMARPGSCGHLRKRNTELMENASDSTTSHYAQGGLLRSILDALAAGGADPEKLDPDDLATVDEFHIGGRSATKVPRPWWHSTT